MEVANKGTISPNNECNPNIYVGNIKIATDLRYVLIYVELYFE
jgi:hypothetical protein